MGLIVLEGLQNEKVKKTSGVVAAVIKLEESEQKIEA